MITMIRIGAEQRTVKSQLADIAIGTGVHGPQALFSISVPYGRPMRGLISNLVARYSAMGDSGAVQLAAGLVWWVGYLIMTISCWAAEVWQ